MACALMAILVVVSRQLAPAHAAPSAPAPEAPPATASPNLFDSIFPHHAAPAATRHSGTAVSIRSAGEAPTPELAEEESALSPSAEDALFNPTNSSFGSQSATLRLQRGSLYPSKCSSLTPYSSCWGGFKATVANGTFALTSTGASSCPTASGSLGEYDTSGQLGFGNFSSGPPTFFLMAGGSGPAPDGIGNITGVGISANDERLNPDDYACVAIYSVIAGGPFLGIGAVSSAAALKLAGWLVPLCTLLAAVSAF